jgi:hypothetical protein
MSQNKQQLKGMSYEQRTGRSRDPLRAEQERLEDESNVTPAAKALKAKHARGDA